MNCKHPTPFRLYVHAAIQAFILCLILGFGDLHGQDSESIRWKYQPETLIPFWQGDVVRGESLLFIRDTDSGEARASLLFPVEKMISIRSSSGEVVYKQGQDYHYAPGSREIVAPAGSRIVSTKRQDLRRPAGTQKYALTHRDGKGEILFGATLEYHRMQTSVTYTKSATARWPLGVSQFDVTRLPHTIERLRQKQKVSMVLLGDSISTGCNSSGWGEGAPYQPPYQELLKRHLQAHYKGQITLVNLSVSGMATPWGLTMIKEVTRHKPDLVILAFGMNDSASLSAEDYGRNTAAMIAQTRESVPDAEFILVASMLGNRDWTHLKHDVFPKYRDTLARLCQPGVALADATSVWEEMLKRKNNWDITGNGVNHPNDFGHRIYAQILASLLVE